MDPFLNDDLAQAAASIDAICDFFDHISPDGLPSPPFAELLQPIHIRNTLSTCESSKREHTGRLAISFAASAHVAKKLPKGWEGAIEVRGYAFPRNFYGSLTVDRSMPLLSMSIPEFWGAWRTPSICPPRTLLSHISLFFAT